MKPARYVWAFLALACLAGCVVLTAARLLAPDGRRWVLVTSFVPYALPAYLLVLLLLVPLLRGERLRRTALAGSIVALLGAALHAGWTAPAYVGSHPSGRPDLTVLSLNMEYGQADPAETARLAQRERADVVVLSEATPEALRALAGRGLGGPGSRWPHRAGTPDAGISGTVVLSRFPLSRSERLDIQAGTLEVTVRSPRPFRLTAVHTAQALSDHRGWVHDLDLLAQRASGRRGPQLLVGDFNATLDHRPMRDLLAAGLRDAATEANSGWQPTWPAGGEHRAAGVPVPFPLIAIDHAMLGRSFAAISTSSVPVPRTDHRALVVELRRE